MEYTWVLFHLLLCDRLNSSWAGTATVPADHVSRPPKECHIVTSFQLVALTVIAVAKVTVVIDMPSSDEIPVIERAEANLPKYADIKARHSRRLQEDSHSTAHSKSHVGCLRDEGLRGARPSIPGGSPHANRGASNAFKEG